MKKTSKVFGAVLCSAALAMGMAMPAFAADTSAPAEVSTGATTLSGTEGSADTNVDVYYQTTQISAKVPIALAIGVTANTNNKASDIVAPSPGSYGITNNSPKSTIYVKTVQATNNDAKWKLGGTSDSDTVTGAGVKGNVDLLLKINSNANNNTISLKDYIENAWTNTTSTGAMLQAAPGKVIALDLSGTSKTIASPGLDNNDFTPGAFTLTYTISTSL